MTSGGHWQVAFAPSRYARRVEARSSLSPFSVTGTVAPVSATTASHNGAAPSAADTRNASFVASARVTFWRITRSARFE